MLSALFDSITSTSSLTLRFVSLYRTSNTQNQRSRRDVVTPGQRLEHAQHVSSLKIYFLSRLTAVASRILKSLLKTHNTQRAVCVDYEIMVIPGVGGNKFTNNYWMRFM